MLAEFREWTVAATRFPRRRLVDRKSGGTRLAAALLSIFALAACGDGSDGTSTTPADPNRAPRWSELLADLALTRGGEPATVDLAGKVSDPDDDALSYTVSSSDSNVATATVAGSIVTVRPLARGFVRISVTARDAGGLAANSSFRVTVAGLPDLVVRVSPDSVAVARGGASEYAVEIANRGDGDMAAATTGHLFRSPDSVITTSDEMMGEPFDVPVLGRGASEHRTASFTAAASAPLGDVFWVGACVEAVEAEDDASNNCSRGLKARVMPGFTYSFVVDGVASSTPTGDARTVIRIAMDTDEAEWSGPGWLPLREDDPDVASKILEMLEIKQVPGPSGYGADHYSDYDLAATVYGHYATPGPISEANVSMAEANSQTVIAVEPPGQPGQHPSHNWPHVWQPGYYRMSFGDAASMEFAIDYRDRFACLGPESGSAFEIVDRDIMVWHGDPAPPAASSMMQRTPPTTRAHPDTTYVIDVAYVLSPSMWPDWIEFIRDVALPDVTGIFQRSGVNVEFRAHSFVAWDDYRHYVFCQFAEDHFGNEYHPNQGSYKAWATFDMIRVLRDVGNGPDFLGFSGEVPPGAGFCGTGALRNKGSSMAHAYIYASAFMVDPTCSGAAGDRPSLEDSFQKSLYIGVTAHEIGHNLGLYHARGNYKDISGLEQTIFHPVGWGYQGFANGGTREYTTIMSLGSSAYRDIPYMSMDTALTPSELCDGDGDREDYRYGTGLCPNDTFTDSLIPLGDSLNNASEALQWTIRDASMYAEYHDEHIRGSPSLVGRVRAQPHDGPLSGARPSLPPAARRSKRRRGG